MKRKHLLLPLSAACVFGLAACQHPQQPPVITSTKSPVELRAMESRAFDTKDRSKTLRAVIATLQDLGYSIEKVEPEAGTVSAIKLSALRLTASVYPRGDSQLMVRANAEIKVMPTSQQAHQVDDPAFYQQMFFEPLAKALFLTALQVEDDGSDGQAADTGGGSESSKSVAKKP